MAPGDSVEMVLRIGLILTMFALACVAQTAPPLVGSHAEWGPNLATEDLLRSAQKRFRPEVWSGSTDSPSGQRTRSSYCVYPSIEARSVAIERWSPTNKIRLLPP